MKINRTMLLSALQMHIGVVNGVTAKDLVAEINKRFAVQGCERDLRHLVKELRLLGYHICAHPSNGYYMASSALELDRTCRFMVDRAMSEMTQVAAMRKIAAPDLYGQLRIPYVIS